MPSPTDLSRDALARDRARVYAVVNAPPSRLGLMLYEATALVSVGLMLALIFTACAVVAS